MSSSPIGTTMLPIGRSLGVERAEAQKIQVTTERPRGHHPDPATLIVNAD
jgi:hypothetical protein